MFTKPFHFIDRYVYYYKADELDMRRKRLQGALTAAWPYRQHISKHLK